jgi:hypothetical protein
VEIALAYDYQLTVWSYSGAKHLSALKGVPLTMIAYGAIDDLRRGKLTVWAQRYDDGREVSFMLAGSGLSPRVGASTSNEFLPRH